LGGHSADDIWSSGTGDPRPLQVYEKRNEDIVSSRRTLILVGAIVVGALAALLILRYVSAVEDKANSDTQLTPVVVVTGPVQQGELANSVIEQKRVDIGQRRRIDLPANAITRLDDIKGQVATIDMSPGEVITTSKFSGSTANTSSKSNVIEKGLVAVTMSVDPTKGVAGLVQPGDFVNVMVPLMGTSLTGEVSATQIGSTTLFQKVKVLAIGQNLGTPVAADPANPDAAKPVASDQVTLLVAPEAAGTIAWAGASSGGVYLVLVRPDYQPRPIAPWVAPTDGQLPGAKGLTPYDGLPVGSEAAQAAGR